MPCSGCGGRKTGVHHRPPIMEELPPFPGEFGFLTLEYTGKAPRPMKWKGPVTGIEYDFGGDKRVMLVDKRDALEMLTPRLTGEASPVFRLYREGEPDLDAMPIEEDHARSMARDPG